MPIIIEGNLEESITKARQIANDIGDNVRWRVTMVPVFSTHYKCFDPHRKPKLRLIKKSRISE
jgi:hypothetical protein